MLANYLRLVLKIRSSCMYVRMYVCMYVCRYVRTYVLVCMYVCMYVCTALPIFLLYNVLRNKTL
jgi:hypothetical protein